MITIKQIMLLLGKQKLASTCYLFRIIVAPTTYYTYTFQISEAINEIIEMILHLFISIASNRRGSGGYINTEPLD